MNRETKRAMARQQKTADPQRLQALRKLDPAYDPTDRAAAYSYLRAKLAQGEYVTGLIYIDDGGPDFHEVNKTTATPINQLAYEKLTPGAKGLEKIMARYK